MKRFARISFTMTRRAVGYGLLGSFITMVAAAIFLLTKKDTLQIWHTVYLDEEFEEGGDVTDFAGYLELEERLFKQLDEEIYAKTEPGDINTINRYQRGSRVDSTSWKTNWNRTFVLPAAGEPRAGVLLLHGMSDSPYSMRALGQSLHAAGATVIGLRIPGHGTIPSGLVRTTWEDMAAAVRLTVRHLRETIGEKPLYLVGYSNGGALTVEYALARIEDPTLPAVDGLALLSPEIGVSPAAALAVWQGRLGRWFGYEKLAYTGVGLEYDPYKYISFATNAGDQAHRITVEIDEKISRLAEAGKLDALPPILAFQSAVDATVSTPALVSRLFARLPERGHELVLFDINRMVGIEYVLTKDPREELGALLLDAKPTFTLAVVSNRGEEGAEAAEVRMQVRRAGTRALETRDLDLSWPNDMFSLSHVALPFPESDLLYGSGKGKITLGNLAFRGERGAIRVPATDMLRQRWNPFYSLIEQRILAFCGVGPAVEEPR
jgi:alpha-beta hydrolase superfamily lysophospholipase